MVDPLQAGQGAASQFLLRLLVVLLLLLLLLRLLRLLSLFSSPLVRFSLSLILSLSLISHLSLFCYLSLSLSLSLSLVVQVLGRPILRAICVTPQPICDARA